MSGSLQLHGLYSRWNSPGQNTGVGNLSFLQGIFPTQEWNPGLPNCRWILYKLSHKGNLRILEWVAYLFSSRSSQPIIKCLLIRDNLASSVLVLHYYYLVTKDQHYLGHRKMSVGFALFSLVSFS